MSCDIDAAAPDRPLHRVGRMPHAWTWPDWSHAGPDGTFGSRFDDPRGEYRVLYASSARRGAYVEVLARFRADPAVEAGLAEIEAESGEDEDGPQPGQLPRDWLESHAVGAARADGAFAAVGSAPTKLARRSSSASHTAHGSATSSRTGPSSSQAATQAGYAPRRASPRTPTTPTSSPRSSCSASSSSSGYTRVLGPRY